VDACPICGHDRFWTRKTVMPSVGLALFDMEWAGSEALNYVCDRCGHILWFIRE
jgi:DNA-directed RNA polymerase subunit RPC12/RpoP